MCNFRIGQKVAATRDLECGISSGQVLTISVIEYGDFLAYDGTSQCVSLLFQEAPPRTKYVGFDARFFRPIVTRKTDISCFTDMLKPKTVEVTV